MAKILDKLKKAHAAVVAQRLSNNISPFGAALNKAAVAAITNGITSEAGKKYMAIFADNPAQLARLTEPQAGEPSYLAQMRAYIVTNACCDPGTNAFLDNRITEEIDGLAGTNDPPVSEEVNDPGNVITDLRPEGLKSIPNVNV